jgi:hypothetical protein
MFQNLFEKIYHFALYGYLWLGVTKYLKSLVSMYCQFFHVNYIYLLFCACIYSVLVHVSVAKYALGEWK